MALARATVISSVVALVKASDVSQPSGNSIKKVIEMLNDMAATCTKEKQAEEVAFAKFSKWCEMEPARLKEEIEQSGKDIKSLDADVVKLKQDAKDLGESVAKLEDKVTQADADMKSAKEQRKKDHTAFLANEQDYKESVDALGRAIAVMQKENYDRPAAAAALLQLSKKDSFPSDAKSAVVSFVSMMDASGDSAPEANAYENQSGGIIDMLKKLEDEFRGKLAELQKAEMNQVAAHNMVVQDLTDTIATDKRTSAENTKEKSRKEEKASMQRQRHDETVASKDEAEKTLASIDTECEEKKLSMMEKQALRAEEIVAINKAAEIMASPDVSLEQVQQAPALALLRSSGIVHRVREFLSDEANRLHSQKIAVLAQTIASDPFGKVKKMIDDMITRLLEEAKADADQEGFCDTEIGKSKVTRNKLAEDISSLEAAVDQGKSTVIELTERVATLAKELADLRASMDEASSMRADEKAKNEATIADARAGEKATAAATRVLKDFYDKAATATGLVQAKTQWQTDGLKVKMGTDEWAALANPNYEGTVDTGHKEGMQTFGKAYTGSKSSGGVMALLEVILSDFAKLVADTETAEAEAKNSHDKFMTEAKKNQAVKEKESEMNEADRVRTQSRVEEDTADMKSTQDELLAADRYYEKLVPQCIDQGMTWEERVAAQEAEIASLKEALKLLNGEGI